MRFCLWSTMEFPLNKLCNSKESCIFLNNILQWVFGGIYRQTKEWFFFAVENRTAVLLIPIIVENIAPGSIIMSEKWKSYNGNRDYNNQLYHLTVNHSNNFLNPESDAQTVTVVRMSQGVAKSAIRHFGNHSQLIDNYLWEFRPICRQSGYLNMRSRFQSYFYYQGIFCFLASSKTKLFFLLKLYLMH